ncbi:T9SS type A sorting domain-containing protein [Gelidibacter gilvus]|uniref:T9SS type A sorting domain-containing protein n=1 Tax=Gelidibacter gilvus TaxID=59602 RepID=UPI001CB8E2EB
MKLYPNPVPSGTAFYVDAGQFEGHKVNLSITDILGKTIYSTTTQFDAYKIAIQPKSSFGSGVYFVHFDQDGRTVNKRLIIQ